MIIIWRTTEYIRPKDKLDYDYILKNNHILIKSKNYILITNKYPYDNTEEHLVLWYKTKNPNYKILNKYRKLWYYIFQNPLKEMSIPELEHIHILKFNN
jgi:hypothetical protein